MNLRHYISCMMISAAVAGSMTMASNAAAASSQPITVLFNGEPAAFEAQPFIVNGVTMVPFRALFEKLELSVTYHAETNSITGEGANAAIELKVGNRNAVVNGTVYELAVAPTVVGGRTFVPLRFVGEATAAKVGWDPGSKTVTVDAANVTAKEAENVQAAYEAYVEAVNQEHADAIERMLHADSPLRQKVLPSLLEAMDRRDVETELEAFAIEHLYADMATVLVTEKNTRRSGAYYMDNRTSMKVTMRKAADGTWKLYDAQSFRREWLTPFGQAGQGAAPGDEEAARQIFLSYLNALNEENVQSALKLVHRDSPQRDATEATIAWMFDTYDLEHELETVRVLERSEDEMYVFTVQKMTKLSGPKLADTRNEMVHTLRYQGNEGWKIYSSVQGEPVYLSLPR